MVYGDSNTRGPPPGIEKEVAKTPRGMATSRDPNASDKSADLTTRLPEIPELVNTETEVMDWIVKLVDAGRKDEGYRFALRHHAFNGVAKLQKYVAKQGKTKVVQKPPPITSASPVEGGEDRAKLSESEAVGTLDELLTRTKVPMENETTVVLSAAAAHQLAALCKTIVDFAKVPVDVVQAKNVPLLRLLLGIYDQQCAPGDPDFNPYPRGTVGWAEVDWEVRERRRVKRAAEAAAQRGSRGIPEELSPPPVLKLIGQDPYSLVVVQDYPYQRYLDPNFPSYAGNLMEVIPQSLIEEIGSDVEERETPAHVLAIPLVRDELPTRESMWRLMDRWKKEDNSMYQEPNQRAWDMIDQLQTVSTHWNASIEQQILAMATPPPPMLPEPATEPEIAQNRTPEPATSPADGGEESPRAATLGDVAMTDGPNAATLLGVTGNQDTKEDFTPQKSVSATMQEICGFQASLVDQGMPVEQLFVRTQGFFEHEVDSAERFSFSLASPEVARYCGPPLPAFDAVHQQKRLLDGTSLFNLASHALKEDRRSISSGFGRSPLERQGVKFADDHTRRRRSAHETNAGNIGQWGAEPPDIDAKLLTIHETDEHHPSKKRATGAGPSLRWQPGRSETENLFIVSSDEKSAMSWATSATSSDGEPLLESTAEVKERWPTPPTSLFDKAPFQPRRPSPPPATGLGISTELQPVVISYPELHYDPETCWLSVIKTMEDPDSTPTDWRIQDEEGLQCTISRSATFEEGQTELSLLDLTTLGKRAAMRFLDREEWDPFRYLPAGIENTLFNMENMGPIFEPLTSPRSPHYHKLRGKALTREVGRRTDTGLIVKEEPMDMDPDLDRERLIRLKDDLKMFRSIGKAAEEQAKVVSGAIDQVSKNGKIVTLTDRQRKEHLSLAERPKGMAAVLGSQYFQKYSAADYRIFGINLQEQLHQTAEYERRVLWTIKEMAEAHAKEAKTNLDFSVSILHALMKHLRSTGAVPAPVWTVRHTPGISHPCLCPKCFPKVHPDLLHALMRDQILPQIQMDPGLMELVTSTLGLTSPDPLGSEVVVEASEYEEWVQKLAVSETTGMLGMLGSHLEIMGRMGLTTTQLQDVQAFYLGPGNAVGRDEAGNHIYRNPIKQARLALLREGEHRLGLDQPYTDPIFGYDRVTITRDGMQIDTSTPLYTDAQLANFRAFREGATIWGHTTPWTQEMKDQIIPHGSGRNWPSWDSPLEMIHWVCDADLDAWSRDEHSPELDAVIRYQQAREEQKWKAENEANKARLDEYYYLAEDDDPAVRPTLAEIRERAAYCRVEDQRDEKPERSDEEYLAEATQLLRPTRLVRNDKAFPRTACGMVPLRHVELLNHCVEWLQLSLQYDRSYRIPSPVISQQWQTYLAYRRHLVPMNQRFREVLEIKRSFFADDGYDAVEEADARVSALIGPCEMRTNRLG